MGQKRASMEPPCTHQACQCLPSTLMCSPTGNVPKLTVQECFIRVLLRSHDWLIHGLLVIEQSPVPLPPPSLSCSEEWQGGWEFEAHSYVVFLEARSHPAGRVGRGSLWIINTFLSLRKFQGFYELCAKNMGQRPNILLLYNNGVNYINRFF